MSVAFTIPTWLLWTLGIIGGVIVVWLAIIGVLFIIVMRKFTLY
jgi:hypothetical protein